MLAGLFRLFNNVYRGLPLGCLCIHGRIPGRQP
jgi:hypothetical protein